MPATSSGSPKGENVREFAECILVWMAELSSIGVRVLVYTACLSLGLGRGHATSRMQFGVNSNLLIEGNRVGFGQSDGSLTFLDLDTGAVILRTDEATGWKGQASLHPVSAGILAEDRHDVRLLDRETLKEVWRANDTWCYDICDDRVILGDGCNSLCGRCRRLDCRALATGKTLWSYDICGKLEVLAEKERVLVYRSAKYEPAASPVVALLDLKTGKQLWRKAPPPGLHFLEAYFDGQQIHFAAGHLPVTSRETGLCSSGRCEVEFEMMQFWDLEGSPIQTLSAPSESRERLLDQSSTFKFAGRYYGYGRMWPTSDAVRPRRTAAHPSEMRRVLRKDPSHLSESSFRFEQGCLEVSVSSVRTHAGRGDPKSWRYRTDLDFQDGRVSWKGFLPYLDRGGSVVQAARHGDRLLLGTDLGHVECIEISTARSRWMYFFPVTVIYEHRRAKPESAFTRAGQTELTRPNLILDPKPRDPYWIDRFRVFVWTSVGVFLFLCLFLCFRLQRRLSFAEVLILCAFLVFVVLPLIF